MLKINADKGTVYKHKIQHLYTYCIPHSTYSYIPHIENAILAGRNICKIYIIDTF